MTDLPSGVLQRTVDVKLRTREWNVIVTVEEEVINWEPLLSALTEFRKRKEVTSSGWATAQTLDMLHRIQKLQHQRPRRRVKRGLIDGIGIIAHSLFGLATDQAVEEVRSKVEENRNQLNKLTQWKKDSLAVINATYEAVRSTRRYLNEMTTTLHYAIAVTHTIMTVKDQLVAFEKAQNRHLQIRADLERGRLTELLFPLDLFDNLTRTNLEHWLPREWYYRWCKVQPLWDSLNRYVVTLPLVGGDVYRGYEVRTYPVWGPDGHAVQVVAKQWATLNTATGEVLEPYRCMGWNPRVCDPGPVHQHGCTSALLGERDIVKHCGVRPLTQPQHVFTVPTLASGLVLFVGSAVTLKERCPGDPTPQQVRPDRGTFLVEWTPGCVLVTTNFTMTSVHRSRTTALVVWKAPRRDVNVTAQFSEVILPRTLPALLPLDMNRMSPYLTALPAITWSNSFTLGTVILIIVVILLFGVILYIGWRSRKSLWLPSCFSKRSKQPESSKPSDEPEIEPASLDDEPQSKVIEPANASYSLRPM